MSLALDLFSNRFACRAFDADREIGKAQIDSILAAAQRSPSGCNRQPWRFIVCQSAPLREQIAGATYQQDFIKDAPCIVVVVGTREINDFPNREARLREFEAAQVFDPVYRKDVLAAYILDPKKVAGDTEIIRDCAIAAYGMMLQAAAIGLGSCWIKLDSKKISGILGLDRDKYEVVCAVPLGYPDDCLHPRPPRLALNQIAFSESLDKPWS